MEESEKKRILTDWWGQCRTCKNWNGKRRGSHRSDMRDRSGSCLSKASPLYLEQTYRSGDCGEWDAFDIDAALEVMKGHK